MLSTLYNSKGKMTQETHTHTPNCGSHMQVAVHTKKGASRVATNIDRGPRRTIHPKNLPCDEKASAKTGLGQIIWRPSFHVSCMTRKGEHFARSQGSMRSPLPPLIFRRKPREGGRGQACLFKEPSVVSFHMTTWVRGTCSLRPIAEKLRSGCC